jgi:hypothetical protein
MAKKSIPKNEHTSATVASKASTIMRDKRFSDRSKSVAASALTQVKDKQTKKRK